MAESSVRINVSLNVDKDNVEEAINSIKESVTGLPVTLLTDTSGLKQALSDAIQQASNFTQEQLDRPGEKISKRDDNRQLIEAVNKSTGYLRGINKNTYNLSGNLDWMMKSIVKAIEVTSGQQISAAGDPFTATLRGSVEAIGGSVGKSLGDSLKGKIADILPKGTLKQILGGQESPQSIFGKTIESRIEKFVDNVTNLDEVFDDLIENTEKLADSVQEATKGLFELAAGKRGGGGGGSEGGGGEGSGGGAGGGGSGDGGSSDDQGEENNAKKQKRIAKIFVEVFDQMIKVTNDLKKIPIVSSIFKRQIRELNTLAKTGKATSQVVLGTQVYNDTQKELDKKRQAGVDLNPNKNIVGEGLVAPIVEALQEVDLHSVAQQVRKTTDNLNDLGKAAEKVQDSASALPETVLEFVNKARKKPVSEKDIAQLTAVINVVQNVPFSNNKKVVDLLQATLTQLKKQYQKQQKAEAEKQKASEQTEEKEPGTEKTRESSVKPEEKKESPRSKTETKPETKVASTTEKKTTPPTEVVDKFQQELVKETENLEKLQDQLRKATKQAQEVGKAEQVQKIKEKFDPQFKRRLKNAVNSRRTQEQLSEDYAPLKNPSSATKVQLQEVRKKLSEDIKNFFEDVENLSNDVFRNTKLNQSTVAEYVQRLNDAIHSKLDELEQIRAALDSVPKENKTAAGQIKRTITQSGASSKGQDLIAQNIARQKDRLDDVWARIIPSSGVAGKLAERVNKDTQKLLTEILPKKINQIIVKGLNSIIQQLPKATTGQPKGTFDIFTKIDNTIAEHLNSTRDSAITALSSFTDSQIVTKAVEGVYGAILLQMKKKLEEQGKVGGFLHANISQASEKFPAPPKMTGLQAAIAKNMGGAAINLGSVKIAEKLIIEGILNGSIKSLQSLIATNAKGEQSISKKGLKKVKQLAQQFVDNEVGISIEGLERVKGEGSGEILNKISSPKRREKLGRADKEQAEEVKKAIQIKALQAITASLLKGIDTTFSSILSNVQTTFGKAEKPDDSGIQFRSDPLALSTEADYHKLFKEVFDAYKNIAVLTTGLGADITMPKLSLNNEGGGYYVPKTHEIGLDKTGDVYPVTGNKLEDVIFTLTHELTHTFQTITKQLYNKPEEIANLPPEEQTLITDLAKNSLEGLREQFKSIYPDRDLTPEQEAGTISIEQDANITAFKHFRDILDEVRFSIQFATDEFEDLSDALAVPVEKQDDSGIQFRSRSTALNLTDEQDFETVFDTLFKEFKDFAIKLSGVGHELTKPDFLMADKLPMSGQYSPDFHDVTINSDPFQKQKNPEKRLDMFGNITVHELTHAFQVATGKMLLPKGTFSKLPDDVKHGLYERVTKSVNHYVEQTKKRTGAEPSDYTLNKVFEMEIDAYTTELIHSKDLITQVVKSLRSQLENLDIFDAEIIDTDIIDAEIVSFADSVGSLEGTVKSLGESMRHFSDDLEEIDLSILDEDIQFRPGEKEDKLNKSNFNDYLNKNIKVIQDFIASRNKGEQVELPNIEERTDWEHQGGFSPRDKKLFVNPEKLNEAQNPFKELSLLLSHEMAHVFQAQKGGYITGNPEEELKKFSEQARKEIISIVRASTFAYKKNNPNKSKKEIVEQATRELDAEVFARQIGEKVYDAVSDMATTASTSGSVDEELAKLKANPVEIDQKTKRQAARDESREQKKIELDSQEAASFSDELTTALNDLDAEIKLTIDELGEKLQDLTSQAQNALGDSLPKVIPGIETAYNRGKDKTQKEIANAQAAIERIRKISLGISRELPLTTEEVRKRLAVLEDVFGELPHDVKDSLRLDAIKQNIARLKETVGDIGGEVGSAIERTIVSDLRDLSLQVKQGVEEAFIGFTNTGENIGVYLGEIAQNLMGDFAEELKNVDIKIDPKKIGESLNQGKEEAKTNVVKAVRGAAQTTKVAFPQTSAAALESVGKLRERIKKLPGNISQALNEKGLFKRIDDAYKKLEEAINTGQDSVSTIFTTAFQEEIDAIDKGVGFIESKLEQGKQQILKSVDNQIEKFDPSFDEADFGTEEISKAVKEQVAHVEEKIGLGIKESILVGLAGSVGGFVLKNIPQGIKKALDKASPSIYAAVGAEVEKSVKQKGGFFGKLFGGLAGKAAEKALSIGELGEFAIGQITGVSIEDTVSEVYSLAVNTIKDGLKGLEKDIETGKNTIVPLGVVKIGSRIAQAATPEDEKSAYPGISKALSSVAIKKFVGGVKTKGIESLRSLLYDKAIDSVKDTVSTLRVKQGSEAIFTEGTKELDRVLTELADDAVGSVSDFLKEQIGKSDIGEGKKTLFGGALGLLESVSPEEERRKRAEEEAGLTEEQRKTRTVDNRKLLKGLGSSVVGTVFDAVLERAANSIGIFVSEAEHFSGIGRMFIPKLKTLLAIIAGLVIAFPVLKAIVESFNKKEEKADEQKSDTANIEAQTVNLSTEKIDNRTPEERSRDAAREKGKEKNTPSREVLSRKDKPILVSTQYNAERKREAIRAKREASKTDEERRIEEEQRNRDKAREKGKQQNTPFKEAISRAERQQIAPTQYNLGRRKEAIRAAIEASKTEEQRKIDNAREKGKEKNTPANELLSREDKPILVEKPRLSQKQKKQKQQEENRQKQDAAKLESISRNDQLSAEAEAKRIKQGQINDKLNAEQNDRRIKQSIAKDKKRKKADAERITKGLINDKLIAEKEEQRIKQLSENDIARKKADEEKRRKANRKQNLRDQELEYKQYESADKPDRALEQRQARKTPLDKFRETLKAQNTPVDVLLSGKPKPVLKQKEKTGTIDEIFGQAGQAIGQEISKIGEKLGLKNKTNDDENISFRDEGEDSGAGEDNKKVTIASLLEKAFKALGSPNAIKALTLLAGLGVAGAGIASFFKKKDVPLDQRLYGGMAGMFEGSANNVIKGLARGIRRDAEKTGGTGVISQENAESQAKDAVANIAGSIAAGFALLNPGAFLNTILFPLKAAISPLVSAFDLLRFSIAPFAEELQRTLQQIIPIQTRLDSVSRAGFSGYSGKELQQEVKSISTEFALPTIETADSFSKFIAAAKGTALEGQKSIDVFRGFSTAIRALSLNTEDANLVMLALQQIMSKGVVSAEEVRQQLGERFPGAISSFAKALNVSIGEFNQLLESGSLTSDVLVGVAKELEITYGYSAKKASNNFIASVQKIQNALTEFSITLVDKFGGGFSYMASIVASLIQGISAFSGEVLNLGALLAIDFSAVWLAGLAGLEKGIGALSALFPALFGLFAKFHKYLAAASFGIFVDFSDDLIGALTGTEVTNSIQTLSKGLFNIGYTAISAFQAATGAAKNFWDTLGQGFKTFAKIVSPLTAIIGLLTGSKVLAITGFFASLGAFADTFSAIGNMVSAFVPLLSTLILTIQSIKLLSLVGGLLEPAFKGMATYVQEMKGGTPRALAFLDKLNIRKKQSEKDVRQEVSVSGSEAKARANKETTGAQANVNVDVSDRQDNSRPVGGRDDTSYRTTNIRDPRPKKTGKTPKVKDAMTWEDMRRQMGEQVTFGMGAAQLGGMVAFAGLVDFFSKMDIANPLRAEFDKVDQIVGKLAVKMADTFKDRKMKVTVETENKGLTLDLFGIGQGVTGKKLTTDEVIGNQRDAVDLLTQFGDKRRKEKGINADITDNQFRRQSKAKATGTFNKISFAPTGFLVDEIFNRTGLGKDKELQADFEKFLKESGIDPTKAEEIISKAYDNGVFQPLTQTMKNINKGIVEKSRKVLTDVNNGREIIDALGLDQKTEFKTSETQYIEDAAKIQEAANQINANDQLNGFFTQKGFIEPKLIDPNANKAGFNEQQKNFAEQIDIYSKANSILTSLGALNTKKTAEQEANKQAGGLATFTPVKGAVINPEDIKALGLEPKEFDSYLKSLDVAFQDGSSVLQSRDLAISDFSNAIRKQLGDQKPLLVNRQKELTEGAAQLQRYFESAQEQIASSALDSASKGKLSAAFKSLEKEVLDPVKRKIGELQKVTGISFDTSQAITELNRLTQQLEFVNREIEKAASLSKAGITKSFIKGFIDEPTKNALDATVNALSEISKLEQLRSNVAAKQKQFDILSANSNDTAAKDQKATELADLKRQLAQAEEQSAQAILSEQQAIQQAITDNYRIESEKRKNILLGDSQDVIAQLQEARKEGKLTTFAVEGLSKVFEIKDRLTTTISDLKEVGSVMTELQDISKGSFTGEITKPLGEYLDRNIQNTQAELANAKKQLAIFEKASLENPADIKIQTSLTSGKNEVQSLEGKLSALQGLKAGKQVNPELTKQLLAGYTKQSKELVAQIATIQNELLTSITDTLANTVNENVNQFENRIDLALSRTVNKIKEGSGGLSSVAGAELGAATEKYLQAKKGLEQFSSQIAKNGLQGEQQRIQQLQLEIKLESAKSALIEKRQALLDSVARSELAADDARIKRLKTYQEILNRVADSAKSLGDAIAGYSKARNDFSASGIKAQQDAINKLENLEADISNATNSRDRNKSIAENRVIRRQLGLPTDINSVVGIRNIDKDRLKDAKEKLANDQAIEQASALMTQQKIEQALLAIDIERQKIAAKLVLTEGLISAQKAKQYQIEAKRRLAQAKTPEERQFAEQDIAVANEIAGLSQIVVDIAKDAFKATNQQGVIQQGLQQVTQATERGNLATDILTNNPLNFEPAKKILTGDVAAQPATPIPPFLEGITLSTEQLAKLDEAIYGAAGTFDELGGEFTGLAETINIQVSDIDSATEALNQAIAASGERMTSGVDSFNTELQNVVAAFGTGATDITQTMAIIGEQMANVLGMAGASLIQVIETLKKPVLELARLVIKANPVSNEKEQNEKAKALDDLVEPAKPFITPPPVNDNPFYRQDYSTGFETPTSEKNFGDDWKQGVGMIWAALRENIRTGFGSRNNVGAENPLPLPINQTNLPEDIVRQGTVSNKKDINGKQGSNSIGQIIEKAWKEMLGISGSKTSFMPNVDFKLTPLKDAPTRGEASEKGVSFTPDVKKGLLSGDTEVFELLIHELRHVMQFQGLNKGYLPLSAAPKGTESEVNEGLKFSGRNKEEIDAYVYENIFGQIIQDAVKGTAGTSSLPSLQSALRPIAPSPMAQAPRGTYSTNPDDENPTWQGLPKAYVNYPYGTPLSNIPEQYRPSPLAEGYGKDKGLSPTGYNRGSNEYYGSQGVGSEINTVSSTEGRRSGTIQRGIEQAGVFFEQVGGICKAFIKAAIDPRVPRIENTAQPKSFELSRNPDKVSTQSSINSSGRSGSDNGIINLTVTNNFNSAGADGGKNASEVITKTIMNKLTGVFNQASLSN